MINRISRQNKSLQDTATEGTPNQSQKEKTLDVPMKDPDDGTSYKDAQAHAYNFFSNDSFICVSKFIARSIGLIEAVVLGDLIAKHKYFSERNMTAENGSFFNTSDNLFFDTGLAYYTQDKAIKNLVNLGLIRTKVQGLPAKKWFNIDYVSLNKFFQMKELETQYERTIKENKGNKNNPSSKEEVNEPDGSSNFPFNSNSDPSDTVPEFKRNPPKQKTIHITPGTFAARAIEEWNKVAAAQNDPANNFRVSSHYDMTTNLAQRVFRHINQLLRGSFFIRNRFDTNFIEKVIPPIWTATRPTYKFTEDQILEGIRLCERWFMGGYWPDKKTGVPKSLDEMIYNPRTQRSWLLWALAQPPKPQEPKGSGGREVEIPAIEDMLARKLEGREREQYARALKALREYWLEKLDTPWQDLNGKTHVNEDGWRQDMANYIRYLGAIDMDIGPWHFKPDANVFQQWLK